MPLRHFIASTALVFGLATASYAEDMPNAQTVVASVNGKTITLGEMIMMKGSLPQQFAQLPDEMLFDGILNQLVQQALLAESIETPPARVAIALKNEQRQLLAAEAIDALLAAQMSEDAIKAAYDTKYANAQPATEWNASHILVETEEAAADLAKQAREGADFAELAKAHSTGPSGPNGGQLGWFGAGMMVPAFEQAVAGMQAEQVSDPVQTQFGWHVIRLNETRMAAAPDLAEVRPEIEAELQQKLIEEQLAKLSQGANIDQSAAAGLDKSLLSRIDLLED
ncbi:MAG: peptidylprolyl isomerase [Lutimaribacter sp.]